MSDDEELLYGLLGTQFNADADIDTENRRLKLKRKVIEDEVTDEKGRALRFHGAFTGGFHAGYFNTVGSKEGFVPQQYVSQNRKGNNKAIRQYKPEDFMDEEDFSEHGIAPKLLKTRAVFDDEDMRKHFKKSLGENSIIGNSDVLKDILVPQRLTVGMMLLRKLGYVASRGVGDNEIELNNNNNAKITEKFDYEPEEMYQLIGQLNKFGLGYSGIRHEFDDNRNCNDRMAVNFGHREKRGIKGTAFGVGVEEEEEDLEDFFSGDSMTKYNYELVDDDDDDDGGGHNRHRPRRDPNFGWTAPKSMERAIAQPGSIIGFQPGEFTTSTVARVVYEPPQPPRFYMPIYPVRRGRDEAPVVGRHGMTERRPQLMPNDASSSDGQTVAASVFDLLSGRDKDRLVELGRDCLPANERTRDSRRRDGRSHSRWGDAPSPLVPPQQHDNVFQQPLPVARPPPQSPIQDNNRHQQRQPSNTHHARKWSLTSSLDAMFKSAGSSTESQDINHCLATVTDGGSEQSSSTSARTLAASTDNYGFMTRHIVEWHPDKLLCKRFNIADPYPGFNFCGVPDETPNRCYIPPVCGLAIGNTMTDERSSSPPAATVVPSPQAPSAADNNIVLPDTTDAVIAALPVTTDSARSSTVPVSVTTTVIDVLEKPEIDLFHAVFADSDVEFSDDDDNDEDNDDVKVDKSTTGTIGRDVTNGTTATVPPIPLSIVSSLEQALTAMIGGGSDNGSTPVRHPPLAPTLSSNIATVAGDNSCNNVYGPPIPPGFVPNAAVVVVPDELVRPVVKHIISRNLPEPRPQSPDDVYEYKEKSKIAKSKKSKKEKKSKKAKSKKSKNKKAKKNSSTDFM